MKKSSILFLISNLLIFSCTKKAELINQDNLNGTWLLKKYDGGQSYQVMVPADTITITFSRSGKFSSSANFSIPLKGNYTTGRDVDGNHYSSTVISLFADNWQEITYGIVLETDTLFLFDGCCDMYKYTYVRTE